MAFALSFVNRRVRIISGNKKEVKSCLRTAGEEDGPDLVARWLRFAFFISGGACFHFYTESEMHCTHLCSLKCSC